MDLLICEEMLLLALDEDKGSTTWLTGWTALSGGVLVDAIEAAAVAVRDDRLYPGSEPEHPLLGRVRAAVAARPDLTLTEWLHRLPAEVDPFLEAVAERLVERGVLTEQHTTIMGIFPTTRFPAADPQPERELRARLRSILVEGVEPDPHDQLLIALVEPAGLLSTAVEDDDRAVRRDARRRGAELAGRPAAPAGPGAAVDAV
ncbi:MAG TPA: GPP34 family phosphoprotein, partial [Pseudonocardia sp.]|nr:GPP34 family phosphoprotein [Pseudonocardia sp.]